MRMINHNRITTNLKRVIDKVAFLSLLHGAFNPEVHKPEGMSEFLEKKVGYFITFSEIK